MVRVGVRVRVRVERVRRPRSRVRVKLRVRVTLEQAVYHCVHRAGSTRSITVLPTRLGLG